AALSVVSALVALALLGVWASVLAGALAVGTTFDWAPLGRSLTLAATASVLGTVLALGIAALARGRAAGASLLEGVSLLPAAVPGIVIGLGYALAYARPPLDLGATLWLAVPALVAARLPAAVAAAGAAGRRVRAGRRGVDGRPHRRGAPPPAVRSGARRRVVPLKGDRLMRRLALFTLSLVLLTATPSSAKDTVVIYTAIEPEQVTDYMKAVNKTLPNLEVKMLRLSTGDISARFMAEKDNMQADVIWGVAATNMMVFKNAGLLEPYAPKGLERVQPLFRDK